MEQAMGAHGRLQHPAVCKAACVEMGTDRYALVVQPGRDRVHSLQLRHPTPYAAAWHADETAEHMSGPRNPDIVPVRGLHGA